MPLVSKAKRSEYLRQTHPVLFRLCVAEQVPEILMYRCNTDLPFCYGRSENGSPMPASWDTNQVEVVPLWESGSGLIAVRIIQGQEEFVQINYEDPENPLVLANTEDGLFAYLFYFLVESSEGTGSQEFTEIEKLASYLNFSKLDLVVEFIRRFSSDSDYEALWAFTRSI